MDTGSKDLINGDDVIGIPVSWRSGLAAAGGGLPPSERLGGEFLFGHPQFERVGLVSRRSRCSYP